MRKKIKAVIFDFNGTMVFDSVYHDKAWRIFSKMIRGYEMSDDELHHFVHGKVNEQIIYDLKPDVSAAENVRLSLEKEALYRKMCMQDKENYQLVKGLASFMDYLKEKNIPFTVASASIKENIDFFVEVFELDKWLDPTTITYNDGVHKDKKSMFLQAAKNLHTPIEDCLIFEDSFIGVKAADEIHTGMIIAIPAASKRADFDAMECVQFTIQDFEDNRIRGVFE